MLHEKNLNIVLILDNLRSALNVGSIIRTADIFAVSGIHYCGTTPYPKIEKDKRLPHVVENVSKKINKVSLGSGKNIAMKYFKNTEESIKLLKMNNFQICALEQDKNSKSIESFKPSNKVAIVLGPERFGISSGILQLCDTILEIGQYGQKESLNVSVATGIALYQLNL